MLKLRTRITIASLISLLAATVALAAPVPSGLLLPEFLNLPFNGAELPAEYAAEINAGKVDMRKLAVTLVERKRQFQNRWKKADDDDLDVEVPATFPKSADEIELVSFFPEQYIDYLIEKGQLNMHQTGESRGLTQRIIRAKAENSMIGIKLEAEPDSNPKSTMQYLRPKYGLVNFTKPCGVKVNPNRLLIYGELMIVYNDDVKMRSMYSYGDSLSTYCHYMAKDLKEYVEPRAVLDFAPPQKNDTWDVRYVEAQIWGPIELSDIKEFRIPKERKDLLEKLKKAGKPVYSYSRENMENCDFHMEESEIGISRGEQLFSPSQQTAAVQSTK